MGSIGDMSSSMTLPIIDISPYLKTNFDPLERANTAAALDRACRDFGFFYVIGHGVPEQMRREMLQLSRQFFALPSAEKEQILISKSMDGVRGYERLGENITMGKRDVLEGLDIYREFRNPSNQMLQGAQLWPDRPASLKQKALEYVDRLIPVGKALMVAMADALGKEGSEEAFNQLTADPFWGMKLIRYPPLGTTELAENEKGISCGEHTDYGGLTFLLADEHIKSVLEVMDKTGGWIKADPVPGAYVVNIGMALPMKLQSIQRVIRGG
jgi:isopenicillin N synthase-like dioxygenase